jgi:3-methyladenine DNA glycosylase/8-oxoguanine DNA glycosylase
MSHIFFEPTPSPFDFRETAQAHGWIVLVPFYWNEGTGALRRIHRLSGGQVVGLNMRAAENSVQIDVEASQPLNDNDEAEIRRAVRRMLRLDEDLSEFHQLYSQMDGWNLNIGPGGGRLLCCPTLFEDIVYTLCTTNITWSGTKRMVERLTTSLGHPLPGNGDLRAFPSPEAIANAGTEFLKQETGLGYRSAYVWELASAVAEGRLDLDDLENAERPAGELYKLLRKIKGVGDYAASTILMLLGRYERLAIDSEMRAFVTKKYCNGQPPTDAEIKEIYAPWGRWQYLAYWFDSPG